MSIQRISTCALSIPQSARFVNMSLESKYCYRSDKLFRPFFFLLEGAFSLLSRPIGGGIFLYDGNRKNRRGGGGRMARWVYFNPNPEGKRVGDCAVRALCKALGQDWEQVYTGLCLEGFALGDMPSADRVWGAYLRRHALGPVWPERIPTGRRQKPRRPLAYPGRADGHYPDRLPQGLQ